MHDAQTIIPRQILFGNPDHLGVKYSPDGKHMTFIAPLDGVLNIWLAIGCDLKKAKPLTHDKKRGIRSYFWSYTNQHVLYTQDTDGDENWQIHAVNIESGEDKNLTPFKDVHAYISRVSEKHPQEIVVGLNDRDPQFHDLYRMNIVSGERQLLIENNQYAGFLCDDEYRVRFATRLTPDGGSELLENGQSEDWSLFAKIDSEDVLTTSPFDFSKNGQSLFMTDSRGRETAALVEYDRQTQTSKIIAENELADISDILRNPETKEIEAAAYNYDRKKWIIFDEKIQADLDVLSSVDDGDLEIVSRTKADDKWIVVFLKDNAAAKYYSYDRQTQKAEFIFSNRSDLDQYQLTSMHPVVIKARDGLNLLSYLTLPYKSDPEQSGKAKTTVPLILYVHGGPNARDYWGYDPIHQWLANRGYAVLSVNYRGSTGLGKSFISAGNGQWSKKMHDDLLDTVEWAIDNGITTQDQVAVMGGSYGGYATLVGLTFTPDVFACGVDIVGPSSLATLLESVPAYWGPALDMLQIRMGGRLDTEAGRKYLDECSPLTYHQNICKPLLIGQGANDPRVKQAESDQIVEAMESKSIPVTYVLYPDEGHGFARPENRLSFYAITEGFFAQVLGGEMETIDKDFEGSSHNIMAGEQHVKGLQHEFSKQ